MVNGENWVGGVVGNKDNAIMENCVNECNVSGNKCVGGLVGMADKEGAITNSYNCGNVEGTTDVGGIFGTKTDTVFTKCYYLDPNGTSDDENIIPVTAEQLAAQSTFEGWNFDMTWKMGIGRPLLKWSDDEESFEIGNVSVVDGKYSASVIIPKVGTYTVFFADYDGNKLNTVEKVTVTATAAGLYNVTAQTGITMGKGDKVMLWDGVSTIKPLCNAYIVK